MYVLRMYCLPMALSFSVLLLYAESAGEVSGLKECQLDTTCGWSTMVTVGGFLIISKKC